jgi:uncharacterized membrane protein YfcA
VVRLVGWLLTPLIAWAASFLGAGIGAQVGARANRSTTTLEISLAFGAVFAIVAAWAWLRFLRRSPRLQEALAVTPEGTPEAAVEGEPPKDLP